jgi:type I restriction enzyme S subunit
MNQTIPSDWSWRTLREVVGPPQYGLSLPSSPEGNIAIIGMKDMAEWQIVEGMRARILLDAEQQDNFRLRRGDLILNRTNSPALVGKLAIWDRDEDAVFASYLVRYPARFALANPNFIISALSTQKSVKQIERLVTRGVSQANINPSAFYDEVEIALPPLNEQTRIVALLDVWDKAIHQTEQLAMAKLRRFNATRSQLIEVRQSRTDTRKGWKAVEFREIAEEIKQRNSCGYEAERVMGVIKGEGLVPMRAHVMAADLRRYLVVPPCATAYNPMRINIGSIATSSFSHDVLVSPDYVVFRARSGRSDSTFLRFLIGTKRWRDHLVLVGSGSVRTRIYFDGLGEMVLRVPGVPEQRRIGQTLSALEQDLIATKSILSALKLQKRGLMKRLLGGEWRLDERFEPQTLPEYQPTTRGIA